MKRTRLTDEQIIGVLAELGWEDQRKVQWPVRPTNGTKCADLCRKHWIWEGTFYNWTAKFGGMTLSQTMRLKTLEDKNAKLKKLLAEQMLDLAAMKDLVSQKWSGPPGSVKPSRIFGLKMASHAILRSCSVRRIECITSPEANQCKTAS